MLSDATSPPRATHDISADRADDFEWVNAWAAATSPASSKPAAPEPVPQGTALVQELAHIPAKPQHAADSAVVQRATSDQPDTLAAPAPVPTEAPRLDSPASKAAEVPLFAPAAAAVPMSVDVPPVAQDVEAVLAPLDTPVVDDASGLSSVARLEPDSEAAAPALAADVYALTAAPELVELIDEQPADEKASAPISFLDFAWRAKRWRNLFGMARHRAPEATEPLDPLEALPSSSDPITADAAEADALTLIELAPAIAPNQIELDVAEIEVRRDALLAEWEHERRTTAATVARSRTTDSVPILLGCVLGFTLLVVFGAAASFVSLR
jgi:hypothetical protein